jgi:cytoskeletal protein CcmA (bactofilin family)
MVFRKESRADSFQRQISALRQQLGTDQDDEDVLDDAEPMPDAPDASGPFTPVAPRPAAAPIDAPARSADSRTGIVAADSVWSGRLHAQGSLQVYGQIEGELTAGDEIFVAEGAHVNAQVNARVVVVAGVVEGTIACSGRLEVLPTGRVSGDVTSPSLVVHEGASIEGDLRMSAPDAAA